MPTADPRWDAAPESMKTAVAVAMLVMGAGIAGTWTRDILAGERVDLSAGFFAARDPDSGTLLWPHWMAEYATAAGLVAGAAGLVADSGWGPPLAGAALGALFYTSTNALGWAFARADRRPYAAPMLGGVVVSVVGIMYLLTR